MSIHINSKNVSDFILGENKDIITKNVNKDYNSLFKYLENYLKNNHKFILKKLNDKKEYQVIDLGESIILCKKSYKKSETILQIGYPFPIIEKKINSDLFYGGEIRICLHKNFLRKHQHKILKMKFDYKETCLKEEAFKRHSLELLKKCKNLYYLDPFNFIGDSIMNLQIFDIFKHHSNTINYIYSRYPECLNCFNQEKLYNLDLKNILNIKEGSIVIIPNFIDIHQITLVQILQELIKKDLTFFVIGRNNIIHNKNKTIFSISGQTDEILLRENVNDLITRSVYRFIPAIKNLRSNSLEINSNKKELKVCLCPFASTNKKSFSKKDIQNIFKRKLKYFNEIYISISGKESKSNVRIIKNLCKNNQFKLLVDGGFGNLRELIVKNNLNIFICMDSASSIFFTKLNKMVFTVYKNSNWDGENLRSLSGESPLGFCSYKINQIPIISRGSLSIEDIEKFIKTIKYCSNNLSNGEEDHMKKIFLNLEKLMHEVKDPVSAISCFSYYKNIPNIFKNDLGINVSFLESFSPNKLFEEDIVSKFSLQKKDLFLSLIKISPTYKFLLNIVNESRTYS